MSKKQNRHERLVEYELQFIKDIELRNYRNKNKIWKYNKRWNENEQEIGIEIGI